MAAPELVQPLVRLDQIDRAEPRPNWWLRIEPRRRRFLLVLVVVAGCGAIAAVWAMPARLDSGGDAAAYTGVARNIQQGLGVTSPFVNEFDGFTVTV